MKYMIASDIHGSAYWCRKLLDIFTSESFDRLVLLGDLLYHGPRNDLPEEYAPKEVAAMLNGLKGSVLAVRGNCEAEVDQMMLEFPVLAEYAFIEAPAAAGNTGIFLTHGHHYNINNPLPVKAGDIMLYGHTHVPLDETRNGIRFLNPGSVSIPKEDSGHGYIVFENNVFTQKYIE